jgi:predicted nucleotidyltransferase component of viral defense system
MLTLDFHLDKNEFVSAIEYTAAETNFEPGLIEKDYFCTVILHMLAFQTSNSLVFKGGTLLAKVHAGFYRLSEDLDFSLPVSALATRKQRSEIIKPIKLLINQIPEKLPGFNITAELKGSNESRQYNAEVKYNSFLGFKQGTILIEIGLREELLKEAEMCKVNTLLVNPFTKKRCVNPFNFLCLSKEEAYAEKIRAALTRDRLAIRDFYDLDYAIKNNIIDINDGNLLNLTTKKIINNKCIEFNDITTEQLQRKLNSELAPTLRYQEILDFDLNETIKKLRDISKKMLHKS